MTRKTCWMVSGSSEGQVASSLLLVEVLLGACGVSS